jgi:uncharacterized protein YyaL (SSP411 family)
MPQSKKNTNQLIHEKSPYLLQHAHNPVNWFAWGEIPFQKAKSEHKPVLLSVGYSTCHWCHVMAHESFEDSEVATLLNRDFVCIKVDREERPDIDAVYMSVCQALTGAGGWPLTVFLTPDQRPFFAGTYFPKHNRYGAVGFIELLTEISRQWKTESGKLEGIGEEVTRVLQEQARQTQEKKEITMELLHQGADLFRQNYDAKWGGFGVAPKFPTPHNLFFLLQYSAAERDKNAQNMAEHTLEQMYRGGIFDHIGGGFSRYSTDDRWLVPHFEKMLYDNALLAIAYLEAFSLTKKVFYQKVAGRILDYAIRELRDPLGGFWCGQDADSDGVEGKYYVFTPNEIKHLLGEQDGNEFCRWFDLMEKGNFEGNSIPNLIDNPDYKEENPKIRQLCEKVYGYRLKRTRLHTDDKVLTSWNGLMIAALAKAGMLEDGEVYLATACSAQGFIQRNLKCDSGRLLLRWRDGEAAIDGQLDDYAFYAYGLIILYQATFEIKYLLEAIQVTDMMVDLFFDIEQGGFYLYAKDSEQLISRPKEVYDGAIPSGNSVASWILEKLAKLTGKAKWRDLADRQFSFLAQSISSYPAGYAFSLTAMGEAMYPSKELICVSNQREEVKKLRKLMQSCPMKEWISVLFKTPENADVLVQIAPFTADYPIPESEGMYYLCQKKTCSAPMNFDEISANLGLS